MVRAEAPGAGLTARLARRIREEGPLSVADLMAAALTDPDEGYYTTRDPLGVRGDFVTAPEVSQMFGELIGLWCADYWQRMGAPDPVILAELGPGRGTLMADALRAASRVPGFSRALRLNLVEKSPVLRRAQAALLDAFAPAWHADDLALPPGSLLLIANEFLDALPIRQFVCSGDGWHERLVGLGADGGFAWTLVGEASNELLGPAPPGTVRETCPEALALARRLGARLTKTGGAALFIDYGYGAGGSGDTLQAVREHRPCAVLDRPGTADLTAHVDFAAFAAAATPARAWGPVTQGAFLRALGIELRASRLIAGASAAQGHAIRAALRRLTDPAAMGRHFKVLALTHPAAPPPDGFSTP